jgi:hypothetical protein
VSLSSRHYAGYRTGTLIFSKNFFGPHTIGQVHLKKLIKKKRRKKRRKNLKNVLNEYILNFALPQYQLFIIEIH